MSCTFRILVTSAFRSLKINLLIRSIILTIFATKCAFQVAFEKIFQKNFAMHVQPLFREQNCSKKGSFRGSSDSKPYNLRKKTGNFSFLHSAPETKAPTNDHVNHRDEKRKPIYRGAVSIFVSHSLCS